MILVDDAENDGCCGDSIIRLMMQGRQQILDVPPEFEIERQKRMYHMLVRSKRYQKLRVEQANELQGLDELARSRSSCISGASQKPREKVVRFNSSLVLVIG